VGAFGPESFGQRLHQVALAIDDLQPQRLELVEFEVDDGGGIAGFGNGDLSQLGRGRNRDS
jgi:hypothetical protein